jgi:hypothetical protein
MFVHDAQRRNAVIGTWVKKQESYKGSKWFGLSDHYQRTDEIGTNNFSYIIMIIIFYRKSKIDGIIRQFPYIFSLHHQDSLVCLHLRPFKWSKVYAHFQILNMREDIDK